MPIFNIIIIIIIIVLQLLFVLLLYYCTLFLTWKFFVQHDYFLYIYTSVSYLFYSASFRQTAGLLRT